MKKQNGITLIALVITIVVLIILAGVAINLSLSEDGIFGKAKEARKETQIAQLKEEISLKILDEQTENYGDTLSNNALETILSSYGNIIYEEDGLTLKGVKTKKGYEVLLSEVYSGKVSIVANKPDISGFNKSNTYYVAWDLKSSPYTINESTAISGIAPSNWYDYAAGVNKWANVKTTGGGNDCYWVWIPRYAYQVPNRESGGETINIKFLKDTTNTPIDGSSITISNNTTEGSWNVHPAFWWDKNNNGVEDEAEQLTGIWVAKFEASSSSTTIVENPTTAAQLEIDGGSDVDTDLQIRVKPNVTSWRNINVNNIFTVCRNLTTSGNSVEGATNIDSHMMKNIEWGACAYLSRSIYGKNSQVWNNPWAYDNTTYYSTITGRANKSNNPDEFLNGNSTVNYEEVTDAYNTGNGPQANDMAGGTWEYTAAIFKVGWPSDDRSELWEDSNAKYVDKYTENTGSASTYFGNTSKYGDAVYETSSSGADNTGSWDVTMSSFPLSGYPLFRRGGHATNGSIAGIFAFNSHRGPAEMNYSFRPCLVRTQS